MGVRGQRHAPAALLQGNPRYPLYMMLGGSQGRSERVGKISSPPGLDLWTVQPVVIRYTDWAIPAHLLKGSYVRTELCNVAIVVTVT
jgi:hypothetical protein